jgi:hypothetical protein
MVTTGPLVVDIKTVPMAKERTKQFTKLEALDDTDEGKLEAGGLWSSPFQCVQAMGIAKEVIWIDSRYLSEWSISVFLIS